MRHRVMRSLEHVMTLLQCINAKSSVLAHTASTVIRLSKRLILISIFVFGRSIYYTYQNIGYAFIWR